ncbi:MAG TPA: hypothetical protein ENN41_03085 [Sediminispirochaeta sp.]|nr:hypothetical protein [Sediminispirochaeta sp.]
MGRSILLTDKQSLLGSRLTTRLMDRGHRVAALVEGGGSTGPASEDAEERLRQLSWNSNSPISVHNVLLESLDHLNRVDDAILLFQPSIEQKPLHEIKLKGIDSFIDQRLKGKLFLMRELLNYFQKRQSGNVYLVVETRGMEVLPPLDAFLLGGIDSFARSLFSLYQNEKIHINGFNGNSPDTDDFADFIVRTITETIQEKKQPVHGKWYRYGEKSMWSALGFSSKK